jgi:hypothetical protein
MIPRKLHIDTAENCNTLRNFNYVRNVEKYEVCSNPGQGQGQDPCKV